jgi:hypothetical protein
LEIDLRVEIQQAVSGTDWHPDDVPDLSLDAWEEENCTQSYSSWGSTRIERLVSEIIDFLEDDAPIILDCGGLHLWFLGVRAQLTESETALLAAAASCVEETISRAYLLRAGLVSDNVGSDQTDAERRIDQFLQQILGKLVDSLRENQSPYFVGIEATRNWLRTEFFIPVRGRGWRKGPLLTRLVVR